MRRLFVFCSAALLVQACGSEDSSAPISGVVHKGPIAEADIAVYRLLDDGSRGDRLADLRTDANGLFEGRVHERDRLVLVARGGRYTDEATGRIVDLRAADELRVYIERDADRREVAITPLTTLAADRAWSRLDRGDDSNLDDAIRRADEDIKRDFDLDGVDLRGDRPADLTRSDVDPDHSRRYGAALAGLSQEISDSGLEPERVFDLIENISDDLSDGIIDGTLDGEALNHGDLPSTDAVHERFDASVDAFIEGDHNLSGTTNTDLAADRETDLANERDAIGDSNDGSGGDADQSTDGSNDGSLGESDPNTNTDSSAGGDDGTDPANSSDEGGAQDPNAGSNDGSPTL